MLGCGIQSFHIDIELDWKGGATSPRMLPMFNVSVGVERRLHEGAWWRTTAKTPWAECRNPPFVFVDAEVLLEL